MTARDPRGLERELDVERPRLDKASAVLGHTFQDRALLLRALTHRSYLNENRTDVGHNEVLELLGDSVVELTTVAQLVRASPGASEGELTDRRAAHVSEPALSARSDALRLVELLRIGKSFAAPGAAASGAGVPVSARADLIEALVGAVFLDAGFEAARAVTERLLGEPPASVAPAENAKRTLQERLQRLFNAPPTYEVARIGAPGDPPAYEARAVFSGQELGRGQGGSKQAATVAAAAAALLSLGDADDVALRERFLPP